MAFLFLLKDVAKVEWCAGARVTIDDLCLRGECVAKDELCAGARVTIDDRYLRGWCILLLLSRMFLFVISGDVKP